MSSAIRNNSSAFGYSIIVSANFALLSHFTGPAGPFEVFTFIAGGVAAFAVVEATITRMFQDPLESEPSNVVALATTFSILSISLAVGLTGLVGWSLQNLAAWPLAAFGSTLTYLLVGAVELDWAERLARKHKAQKPEDEP
jgi:undecaprenyl pyrophosphate phosphatase UppP